MMVPPNHENMWLFPYSWEVSIGYHPHLQKQPLQSLAGYLGEHVIPRHNSGEKQVISPCWGRNSLHLWAFHQSGRHSQQGFHCLAVWGVRWAMEFCSSKIFPFPVRIWLFTWEIEMMIVYEFAGNTWMMARKLKMSPKIENGKIICESWNPLGSHHWSVGFCKTPSASMATTPSKPDISGFL